MATKQSTLPASPHAAAPDHWHGPGTGADDGDEELGDRSIGDGRGIGGTERMMARALLTQKRTDPRQREREGWQAAGDELMSVRS